MNILTRTSQYKCHLCHLFIRHVKSLEFRYEPHQLLLSFLHEEADEHGQEVLVDDRLIAMHSVVETICNKIQQVNNNISHAMI